ncbi:MAG TPA: hypothetical protein VJC03_06760 [bacterium]|nr:hypothetical protein [bacterium]
MRVLLRIVLFPLVILCYICPLCLYARVFKKEFIIKNMSRICPFCWAARKSSDLANKEKTVKR